MCMAVPKRVTVAIAYPMVSVTVATMLVIAAVTQKTESGQSGEAEDADQKEYEIHGFCLAIL